MTRDIKLRFTLLGEGSSDRVLIHPIEWLLMELGVSGVLPTWADISVLGIKTKTLKDKIKLARSYYDCDLLFVHRDSDNVEPAKRREEINMASDGHQVVPVVPVRMQEAWLLIDELAIRKAANRPSGRAELKLPPIKQLEAIADPKMLLHQALRDASECTGRKARRFRVSASVFRLASQIDDWSPLRELPAFQRLETDTIAALNAIL